MCLSCVCSCCSQRLAMLALLPCEFICVAACRIRASVCKTDKVLDACSYASCVESACSNPNRAVCCCLNLCGVWVGECARAPVTSRVSLSICVSNSSAVLGQSGAAQTQLATVLHPTTAHLLKSRVLLDVGAGVWVPCCQSFHLWAPIKW